MRVPRTPLERLAEVLAAVREAQDTYARSRDRSVQARSLQWLAVLVPQLAEALTDVTMERHLTPSGDSPCSPTTIPAPSAGALPSSRGS